MPITLHIWKPPASVIAPHHELVDAFYSADLDNLRTPDPSMRDAAAKLSQIVGYEVPAQKVITLEIDPANADQQIGQIEHLAFVDKLLVFLGDAGLYVNASGLDLQETFVPVQMTSSTGTVWRQVGERTVDIAFEDALRAPDPVGAWILVVTTYGKADTYGGSLSMRLEADGQWTLTLRYAPSESGEQKPAQILRVATYEEARSILLAFADICEEIHELDWRDAAPGEATLRPMAYQQNMKLPLRRLDAVADLPAGTMMRLHDPYWGELRYGRTPHGAWHAAQVQPTGVRVSRDFSTLDELMAVVHAFSKGNGHSAELKAAFGGDIQALSSSNWGRDVVEVTAMVLPHRGPARMNSTVRFLHDLRARRNQPAPPQMEDFVGLVNRILGDMLVDGPAHPAALTRMRLRNPGSIPQLFGLAADFGVSVVVHGDHVLYNSSGVYNEGYELDPVRVFNNGLPFQGWNVSSVAAFAEGVAKVANGCQLSAYGTGPVGTRGHKATYETVIFENENGLAARLYFPDGTVYGREEMTMSDAAWLFSIAGQPGRVSDQSLWESRAKQDVPDNKRFLSVFATESGEHAGPLRPETIPNLRERGMSAPGERFCVLDLAGDDSFVEVRVLDEDQAPFEVECRFTGGDGVEHNYSLRFADFQYAMEFVEAFITGEQDKLMAEMSGRQL